MRTINSITILVLLTLLKSYNKSPRNGSNSVFDYDSQSYADNLRHIVRELVVPPVLSMHQQIGDEGPEIVDKKSLVEKEKGVLVYRCLPGGIMIPIHVVSGMDGAIMVLPRECSQDENGNSVKYDEAWCIVELDYYIPKDQDGNYKEYNRIRHNIIIG